MKRRKPTSSTPSEANKSDKIIKENLKPLIEPLIRRVFGLKYDKIEFVPVTKQQTTLEREPDFICILYGGEYPEGAVLHIEFETGADKEMADRMLEYLGIERRRFKLPILPFVIYIGAGNPHIPNKIEEPGLEFSFRVYKLNNEPFDDFIHAGTSEEVVASILTDFGGRSAEETIRMIIARLIQLKKNKHSLNKFLKQLRILAKMRNLQPVTQNLIQEMVATYKIEEDVVFIEGKESGLIEGQDFKDHLGTFNMLDKGFDIQTIADILEISTQKVLKIKVLWEIDLKIKEISAQGAVSADALAQRLGVGASTIQKVLGIEKVRRHKSK